MKLIETKEDHFVFHLGKREKRLLFETLQLYPLIPAAHHRVTTSDSSTEFADNQKLLDEALAERRRENRTQVLAMLNEEGRFRETEGGFRVILTTAQMDWLLQVLNDIRVGSWLVLGEPDEKHGKKAKLTVKNVAYLAAMEFCGYFQMTLLDALEGKR